MNLLTGLLVWTAIATAVGLLMGRIMYDTNEPDPSSRASGPTREEAA
jgi:hypothetical protein